MWGMGTIIRLHIPNQPMVRLCFDCVPAILQIPTLRANQKRLCDALRRYTKDIENAGGAGPRARDSTQLSILITLGEARPHAALLREVEGE